MESIIRGTNRKIMVVDDDNSILSVVREIFDGLEFDVVTASGAHECLGHLCRGFRGLILMDVVMPEKDGWDTIRAIEDAGLLEGNIFVMLTGQEAPDERMDGLQELVVDYIRKPFEPHELVASVRRYCGYLES